MVKEWWSKQTGISQVCGLEIILESGNIHTYICALKLENNAISIIHQSGQPDLKSTLEKLRPHKIPLAVNFSGEGVISRVVPVGQSGSAVDSAFPGIEKEKFYIQELSQKNHVIVSLVNRNIVDPLLDRFKDCAIINISLGGIVPSIIRENNKGQQARQLDFGPHRLFFDKTMDVVGYEFKKENREDTAVRFQGIKVNGSYLNAFAQAFQLFFYPQLLPIGIKERRDSLSLFYRYGQIKFAFTILLVFVFVVLLVNFLLWNSWSGEKKDMENQLVFSRGMTESRDSLLSRTAQREQRLKNLGILPFSHQRLIYEIGNMSPPGIKLTAVEINPNIENKGTYGQIIVRGELQNVNAYGQFKKKLNQSKLKLEIIGEELSYNENKNVSLFEMRLSLY